MRSHPCKELVQKLLRERAGPFSPLTKIFAPHLEYLRKETELPDGTLNEVIFNALNDFRGRKPCEVCGKPTKFYAARNGWAKYCSKQCMNSVESSRHKNSEETKRKRNTGIGNVSIRQKAEQTLLQKYGAANPSHVPEIKARRANTFIEKYGVDTPFKSGIVKNKIKHTMIEKYGGTGRASIDISDQITRTTRQNILQNLTVKLDEWEILTEELQGLHVAPIQLKHICGYVIQKFIWTGQHLFNPRCPKCHGSSEPQKRIIELVRSLGFDCKVNDRKTIKPRELDIVIPSKSIAIEVNGVRFHGEQYGKDIHYHVTKTDQALAKGYHVLHFSDLDVYNRWDAVKHTVMSKLGVLPKMHARDCEIKEVSRSDAKAFLQKYHLQGACNSSVKLGLYHGGVLVALMTFGQSRFNKHFDFELLRFASCAAIRGGASKLLARFGELNPGKTLISYADRRWSTGKMYETLGFKCLGISKPGYWYVKDGAVFHRSLFQKHKLGGDPTLTEAEIMRNRGYDRIWDCGSIKYMLTLPKRNKTS